MSNKGKTLKRRSAAEILQAQQLTFAKTILRANGYTYFKEKPTEDDWAMPVSDIFKRIRADLKLLESLEQKNWGKEDVDKATKVMVENMVEGK